MKKVVMIIAANGFRDEELFTPKQILEKNGVGVTVASTSLNSAQGMLGGEVTPDILLQDVAIADYAAVVFIGGAGASIYWHDKIAHKLAQDAFANGKVVAAICIAPVTLANAGILNGKKATVWQSEAGQLKAKGADYTAMPVEVDGKIITASGPFAAKDFAESLLKAIGE